MKKIFLLLAALFIANAANAQAREIVFFGDSITKGTDYGSVKTEDTFAYKIAIANGFQPSKIKNLAVSSATSADVLSTANTYLTSNAPDLCVLMVGINDWSKKVPIETFKANIKSIADKFSQRCQKTIFITSNIQRGTTAVFSGFQPYLIIYEDVAFKENIPVIDLYREVATSYFYLSGSEFLSLFVDNVHLTKKGHDFVKSFCERSHNKAHFQN